MSSAGHLSELESLRSQVADLTRALAERDRPLDRSLQDQPEQSDLLRAIVEGTAAASGEEFFRSLVRHLAQALNVRYAFVGEWHGQASDRVHALAVWSGTDFAEPFEYSLPNTPCAHVVGQRLCLHESGVQRLFPEDHLLAHMNVESYCGMPLFDKSGKPLGILVIMDDRPMTRVPLVKDLLQIFGTRAGAELQHHQAEEALRESERRLRLTQFAVDHAEDGVLWADDSKRFMYANEAACRLLGYSNEELLTLSISDIAPYHDPARFQQRLDQIKQGTVATYESIHRRKDGTEFPVEASVTCLEHEGKGYTCGIVRDITERKRIEQERAQALADLHNVIEAIPDIVFALDTQGNLVKWNRRLVDVTGYSSEELLNKPALAFVPPEEQTRTAAAILQAFTEGYAELDGHLLTKDFRAIPYHVTSALLRDSQGEPIGITGMGRDVSDKKRAEEELHESEQRFALAVEGSNDILWDAHRLPGEPWYAPETSIWWSPRVRELLDLEESESFETLEQWAARLHPDDKDRVFGQLAAHIEQRVPYDVEYRLRTNRGDYRWVRGRGQALWDDQGEPRRMSGSCQDITERKQVEKALCESEERYRMLIDLSPNGVFVYCDGKKVYVNQAACTILGASSSEQLLEDPTFRFSHPDAYELIHTSLAQILATGEPVRRVERKYQRLDGTVVFVEVDAGRIMWNGEPAVQVIFADITEHKRAEEERQKQEALITLMLNTGPACIKRVAADGSLLHMNLTGLKMIEACGEPEVVGRSVFDLIIAEHRDAFISMHRSVIEGHPCMLQFEIQGLKGTRRWMESYAVPFRNPVTGQTEQMAVTHDITHRKQAEEALLASEERFDLAVRGSNTGIWDWDLRTDKTYFSPFWKSMLGYEEDELRGEFFEWEERLHPDDRERSSATVQAYLEGVTPQYELEHRLRHKDGSYRWILARGVSIRDTEGKPYRMAGSHIDITEQRQIRDALVQSERQLRIVLDALPVGVWFTDRAGKTLLANQAAKQIWSNIKQIGLQTENLQAGWWETIRPANEPHRWALSHVLTTGVPSLNETVDFECLDGTKKIIRNSTVPVKNEDGLILGAIMLNEDITALRQAQAALQLTQFSVDHAVEGFLWMGPDARIFHVNGSICRMLEYTWEELTTMTLHDLAPDLSSEAWPAHWDELRKKGSLTFESKYWSKTGRVLDMEVTVNYLQYEGKEYNCAIMRDIGERKRAEALLRQSEERYRSLVDNAPIGIFLNEAGRFVYANREMLRILKATSAEQLIGTPVLDRIAPEFHTLEKDRILELTTGQSVLILDEKFVRLDGSQIDVAVSAIPASPGGNLVIQVLALDIAERKRMEETLRQRERDLQAAMEERERISQDLHDGILQSLFAVGLALESAKLTMPPRNFKVSRASLNQAIDQLNDVMREIRNFISGLGSDLLQGKSLPAALKQMLESLTEHQATRVRLAVEDRAVKALSTEQSLHLVRVIQEAVSNCIKHGHAQEARVSLKMLKRGVRLSVRDNGRGFNQDAAKKTGHGLANMTARAQKMGGRFTVLSKVNEGTRIVLDLPNEAADVRR